MTAPLPPSGSTAAALRAAFDRGFAEAPADADDGAEAFVAVRIGGERYAIRVADVASVHRDRNVVSVGATAAGLLGVAGFRGVIAPVYDLRVILGHPGDGPCRWLVLVHRAMPVAFGFDLLESQFRLRRERRSAGRSESGTRRYVSAVAPSDAGPCPILDVAALVTAVSSGIPDAPSEER